MKPRQATPHSAEIAHDKRKGDNWNVQNYGTCPTGGNGTTEGVFELQDSVFRNVCILHFIT